MTLLRKAPTQWSLLTAREDQEEEECEHDSIAEADGDVPSDDDDMYGPGFGGKTKKDAQDEDSVVKDKPDPSNESDADDDDCLEKDVARERDRSAQALLKKMEPDLVHSLPASSQPIACTRLFAEFLSFCSDWSG